MELNRKYKTYEKRAGEAKMNCKKSAFWIIALILLAVVVCGVCFLVNLHSEKAQTGPVLHIGVNARILEIDIEEQTMLVKGLDEKSILGDQCTIGFDGADFLEAPDGVLKDLTINDFSVGDEITVDVGRIYENYPVQTTTARVQLISKTKI